MPWLRTDLAESPLEWPVSHAGSCTSAEQRSSKRVPAGTCQQGECFERTANGGFGPMSRQHICQVEWALHWGGDARKRRAAPPVRRPQLQLQCEGAEGGRSRARCFRSMWVEDHQAPIGLKLIFRRTNHANGVRRPGSRRDVSIRRTAPRRGWKRATGLCLVHLHVHFCGRLWLIRLWLISDVFVMFWISLYRFVLLRSDWESV